MGAVFIKLCYYTAQASQYCIHFIYKYTGEDPCLWSRFLPLIFTIWPSEHTVGRAPPFPLMIQTYDIEMNAAVALIRAVPLLPETGQN